MLPRRSRDAPKELEARRAGAIVLMKIESDRTAMKGRLDGAAMATHLATKRRQDGDFSHARLPIERQPLPKFWS